MGIVIAISRVEENWDENDIGNSDNDDDHLEIIYYIYGEGLMVHL